MNDSLAEVLDCDPEVSQEWTLTEELTETPVGPELGATLAKVDRASLDTESLLRLTQARVRQIAHLEAQLLADLHAVARTVPDEGSQPGRRDLPGKYPWAEVEAAMALSWTRSRADAQMIMADDVIDRLPVVFDALNTGRIDVPKMRVIVDLLTGVDDELARALAAAVIDKAAEQTTGQLRARLRRLLLAADAQVLARKAQAAVRGRRVLAYPNDESLLANLAGYDLPPHRVAAIMERLDAIAKAFKAAGDTRSMDQLRADAYLDLLAGEGLAAGGDLSDGGWGGDTSTPPPGDPRHQAAEADSLQAAAAATDAEAGRPDHPTDQGSQEGAGGETGLEPQEPREPQVPQEPDGLPGLWAFGRHDRPPHPDHDPTSLIGDSLDPDPAPTRYGLHTTDNPDRWWDLFDQLPTNRPPRHCVLCGTTTSGGGGQEVGLGPGPGPGQPAGPPSPAPRQGVVEIVAPLSMLLRLSDLPAELTGYGPVVADIARQVTASMNSAQWRFSIYDQMGQLAWHGTTRARPQPPPDPDHHTTRRPPPILASYIRSRDRTCRAPGCRRPARRCDIDHTRDWAKGGETIHCNLACLCKMHHMFKDATGSRLVQLSPGILVWDTPAGMQYLTRPDHPLYDHTELEGLTGLPLDLRPDAGAAEDTPVDRPQPRSDH